MAIEVYGDALMQPRYAAEVLGIGVKHLASMAKAGKVERVQLENGRTAYRRESVEAYLNARRS